MKVTINCSDCDAVYSVQHTMEKEAYSLDYCPFCAAPIYEEYDEEDLDPDDDEEWI